MHAIVLRMSDPEQDSAAGTESGLTEDHFSPVWTDDDRPRIPRVAGEREALTAYLDYYRATLEMKCRGVTPDQARARTVPPSTLSLHGLVRHLASTERWWFQQNFERRDVPFLFFTADQPDLDFDPPADADLGADLETWRKECAVSREIVAAHDLDDTARPLDWYEDGDLRWLVLRMIAEYAQHCGHVDLLREAIDGRTGAWARGLSAGISARRARPRRSPRPPPPAGCTATRPRPGRSPPRTSPARRAARSSQPSATRTGRSR